MEEQQIIDNEVDIELPNVMMVLEDYADEFKKIYRERLKRDDWYASGDLYKTIKCEVVIDGYMYSVVVALNHYYKYLERGRGSGKCPVSVIRKWLVDKKIEPRNRGLQDRDKALTSAAFAISRSISQKGWYKKPTLPLVTTIEEMNYVYKEFLQEALLKDCEKSLIIMWSMLPYTKVESK